MLRFMSEDYCVGNEGHGTKLDTINTMYISRNKHSNHCHSPLSRRKSVGIKRLHDDLEVTAAKVCVTAAK
ncbi:hypothetical protein Tco_1372659 [Tanacetum coccineum]